MAIELLREQLEGIARELAGPEAAELAQLERPRNPEHGDVATNLALALASRTKRPPRQLAQEIISRLDLDTLGVAAAEIAGPGFINFRLAQESVIERLREIALRDDEFGRSRTGAGEAIIVEWVSANPTGPLHFGHGRQAALGDAISNLLEATGWNVHREFYYNDSGTQMELLARSVWARYQQLLGSPAEIPEGGYHGEYVLDVARQFLAESGDRFRGDASAEALDTMRRFAVRVLRAEQDRDLADFRVRFDQYFLESALYDEGHVEATIRALEQTGLVYEHEGALWLRTTEFGDQKDRVMVRRNGAPTYFLPDVAYHVTKWHRAFHHAINVQGADHHGTVPRVRAGLQALGLPAAYPEYVLHQMVRLERGGEEVKISKRAGSYTTLRELYEMVGVDVARYFFLMRRPEAHLIFDIDMALDQSEKNPVYKIQYAHARMCSIFTKAGVSRTEINGESADLAALGDPGEHVLIKQLAEYANVVEAAARLRAPHLLCDYLEQTAAAVNSWYHAGNPSRNPELSVLVDNARLREARLVLALGIQIVLRNGLGLLGLSAPERMEREDSE
ncbi:MAG: arginine--tRNA ligase [Longimicrobiales bacterium]